MKKLITSILVFTLVLSLTACNNDEQREVPTGQQETTDAMTKNESMTTAGEVITSDETTSKIAETEASTLNAGLVGQELVKAVLANFKEPQNLYAKLIITSSDLQAAMHMIYYVNDKSHKTSLDMFGQGVYNHTLYLAEDSYIYNYTDGETQGFKYLEESTDLEDDFLDLSFGAEDLDEIEDLAEAKIEFLDGKECLYVKFIEDEGNSNEVWISLKHSFPVRMIVKNSENVIEMQMDVVEIETNKDFSSEFVVPVDITFIEQ